ncbi:hypothetical protein BJY04DRAFT_221268 [Aspergillus karnatakaensis]|uniref:Zn(II)2Cys6 transcription factor domain-containing protein n=1 Tax=Aspergillus karnatakaensis TaxID=1810916 RepID=UPI003CCD89C1
MTTATRPGFFRLKSRTGCKTCKIRRIKCGEERPHCLRCSSTGRVCDYERPLALATPHPGVSRTITRIMPTASPESRERRAFEFYFFHAAPSLSDALDLDFWRGTVLRLCGSEPAIWDAIAALSTFYEHPPAINSVATYQIEHTDLIERPRSKPHREAFGWYSRSLRKLQDQIQRGGVDHAVALVSCVLFLCIEMLQGNVKGALMLYHQGMQLMESMPAESRSGLETAIRSILVRVGTIAVIVSRQMPVPARLPGLERPKARFGSLADARSALYALVADWKAFDDLCAALREMALDTVGVPMSDLEHQQEALEASLSSWDIYFQNLPEVIAYTTAAYPPQTTASVLSPTPHQSIIATLSMTHLAIQILTHTGLSQSESAYDMHSADFAKIISHAPAALAAAAPPPYLSTTNTSTSTNNSATQPPSIFDMGTRMSLFITILKCRDPLIRRQALGYLRQAPPLQGMYFSHSAAEFLAALVAVEELGVCSEDELRLASVMGRQGRVPGESERVFALQLVPRWVEGEKGTGGMRTALEFSRRVRDGNDDGEVRIVRDMVVLPARAPHRPLAVL